MIKPTLTDSILERFRLWREFLLRSERYRTLCDFVEEKKEEHPCDHPLIKNWCPVVKMLDRPYVAWKDKTFTREELARPYDDTSGKTYGDILTTLYPLFQNVFIEDFSDVEIRIEAFYETADFENELPFIIPASEHIFAMLSSHPMFHADRRDVQINAGDLFTSLVNHIRKEIDQYNIISLNPLGYGKEEMKKEFSRYLDSTGTKETPQKQVPYRWDLFITDKRCYPAKFRQMLVAYDSKQVLPRPEAIEATFPKDSRDSATVERNFDQFVRQAKQLIRNAETGQFPGEYGK